MSDVSVITALTPLVTPVVMIGVAYWAFRVFQKRQLLVQRHTIVRLLEQDVMTLFRTKSARVLTKDSPGDTLEVREFRAVLDNKPPWTYEVADPATVSAGWHPPPFRFIDGERHWLIRRNESEAQYLSSQAFHESFLWFRRLAYAYRDNVVTADDLVSSWRFVLPFAHSGRLGYLSRYFEGTGEVDDMVFVINATLQRCCDLHRLTPLKFFHENATGEDRQILKNTQDNVNLISELDRLRMLKSSLTALLATHNQTSQHLRSPSNQARWWTRDEAADSWNLLSGFGA